MTNYPKFSSWFLFITWMLITFTGCAHKPFDPPETGEIPKGPGVFTKGDDGAVLFDSKKRKAPPADKPHAVPAVKTNETYYPTEAYEEFEAYQQWLEWKKSNVDTDAYREFKQWQEWRRYQDWKKKK